MKLCGTKKPTDELTIRFGNKLQVEVHHIEDPVISQKLDAILTRLGAIEAQEARSMAELSQEMQDLVAEVEVVKGVQASAKTLIEGISAKIDEAIAGADAATRAKLVDIKADLTASTDALAAAVAANP